MLWTLDVDDLCRQINARDAHLHAHGCSRRSHRCKRIAQRGKGSQYCNHTVHRCKYVIYVSDQAATTEGLNCLSEFA